VNREVNGSVSIGEASDEMLGTAEWFAETYNIRGVQHFALLVFWLHTEVVRRAVAMGSRVSKRRKRRLQFVREQTEISAVLAEKKHHDPLLLNLFTDEFDEEEESRTDLGKGKTNPRARIKTLNGRRTFIATRGILKNKSGYTVSVPLPEGGTAFGGTFTNNVTAALAYDAAVRQRWHATQAEDKVNLSKANTDLLSLGSATTHLLVSEWYNRDQAVERSDNAVIQRLSIREPVWRNPVHLHKPIVFLAKVTGKRKYTKRKKEESQGRKSDIKMCK
jgi:hypothetical protein